MSSVSFEERVEARLGALEQSDAAMAAELHAQRQTLSSISGKLDNIIALRADDNKPNMGMWIALTAVLLTVIGSAVAPLWFHVQDGHPARVEGLVDAQKSRLDEYKLEANRDRERNANAINEHEQRGAHVGASKDIAKLEGRMDALESAIQDIDKYGSRKWVDQN